MRMPFHVGLFDFPCLPQHAFGDGDALIHQPVAEGLLFVAGFGVALEQRLAVDGLRVLFAHAGVVFGDSSPTKGSLPSQSALRLPALPEGEPRVEFR